MLLEIITGNLFIFSRKMSYEWRQIVRLFRLAKTAWSTEERKILLSENEIIEIDQYFFNLGLIVNLSNPTRRQKREFFRKFDNLKTLISHAERKMGYITLV